MTTPSSLEPLKVSRSFFSEADESANLSTLPVSILYMLLTLRVEQMPGDILSKQLFGKKNRKKMIAAKGHSFYILQEYL